MNAPYGCPRGYCSHASFVHDWQDVDEQPLCCVEDCDCGRTEDHVRADRHLRLIDGELRGVETAAVWAGEHPAPDLAEQAREAWAYYASEGYAREMARLVAAVDVFSMAQADAVALEVMRRLNRRSLGGEPAPFRNRAARRAAKRGAS